MRASLLAVDIRRGVGVVGLACQSRRPEVTRCYCELVSLQKDNSCRKGHACILAYDTHLHLFLPLEVGT